MNNQTRKRKCKQCGDYKQFRFGIQTPVAWFCSVDHAKEYAIERTEKARERQIRKAKQAIAKKEKIRKRKDRERKESLKTAGDYIKEAQTAVNKYVRLRDRNKPCISCGSMPEQKYGGNWDAGHYRSRGSASHLRFNLLNIHKQCVKCNRFNSGNVVEYRINLIKKIGLDNVEKLENDNQVRKFTIDYLKRVKQLFNKRARRIEKRL